jgi:hypothetical protein
MTTPQEADSSAIEESRVIRALEPDQLAAARKSISRLELRGGKLWLLWLLRIYVVVMAALVIYQVCSQAGQ